MHLWNYGKNIPNPKISPFWIAVNRPDIGLIWNARNFLTMKFQNGHVKLEINSLIFFVAMGDVVNNDNLIAYNRRPKQTSSYTCI